MITYLRMSSAWHKADGPARVPRSLAGDGEGCRGRPGSPGRARTPVRARAATLDQHHDGGQARTVTTARTESAILRGWKRPPPRQPGERGIGIDMGALARRRMLCSSRWVIPGLAEG